MNLLDILLNGLQSKDAIAALSKKTGIKSSSLKALLPAAVPLLMKLLTKNASDKDGANSLLAALSEHVGTEPAAKQIAEADTVDGGKILNHIFGDSKSGILASLATLTNLNESDITKALSGIAPVLLTALSSVVLGAVNGKKKSAKGGFDLSGVLSMLGGKNSSGILGFVKNLLGSKSSKKQKKDSSINGVELLTSLLNLVK